MSQHRAIGCRREPNDGKQIRKGNGDSPWNSGLDQNPLKGGNLAVRRTYGSPGPEPGRVVIPSGGRRAIADLYQHDRFLSGQVFLADPIRRHRSLTITIAA